MKFLSSSDFWACVWIWAKMKMTLLKWFLETKKFIPAVRGPIFELLRPNRSFGSIRNYSSTTLSPEYEIASSYARPRIPRQMGRHKNCGALHIWYKTFSNFRSVHKKIDWKIQFFYHFLVLKKLRLKKLRISKFFLYKMWRWIFLH